MDINAIFGLGGGSAVAGCGNNDPLTGSNDPSVAALIDRLRMRNLLAYAPQMLAGGAPTTNPVLAGASTITITPPIGIRPTRLDWPASTAPFFTISSMKVGVCDVIVVGAPSAESFIANANNPPIEFGILCAGTPLQMAITNIDANAHRADVTIWGVAQNDAYGKLTSCC